MFNFFDHILTMPTKSATTVVLLRNELRAATGSISRIGGAAESREGLLGIENACDKKNGDGSKENQVGT